MEKSDRTMEFSTSLEKGQLFNAGDGEVAVSMFVRDMPQSADRTEVEMETFVISTTEEADEAEVVQEVAANQKVTELEKGLYSRTAKAEIVRDAPSVLNLKDKSFGNREAFIPENLQSSLLYEEVFSDVDLMYTAYGYHIKEQIIVKEPQKLYRYGFLLQLEGLEAQLEADGSVLLKDAQEQVRYMIPAPYMADSIGEISFAAEYILEEVGDGILLTVEADENWMNSKERVFPVTIDPTLISTTGQGSGDVYATYTQESDASTNYHGNHLLIAGQHAEGYEYRTFLYVNNLPELPSGCEMVGAGISLAQGDYEYVSSEEFPLAVYACTTQRPAEYASYLDWFKGITWHNMPVMDTGNMLDYQMLRYEQRYVTWDITEQAKKWYQGEENRLIGFATADKNTYSARAVFYSAYTNNPPVLTISYRNQTGIEPYYTYQTMGVGNAGTAYVSDFSGQLKAANTVLSYASTVNPFALELVYNSDYFQKNAETEYHPATDLGLNMQLGCGWTMNVVQKIEDTTIGERSCLKYRDGDGTDHYFFTKEGEVDNVYYDEDGLNLKITKTAAGAYKLTDDNGNTWQFENQFLFSVTDSNGNQQLLHYNANAQIIGTSIQNKDKGMIATAAFYYDGQRITSVNDAAGNKYIFHYSTDGRTLTGLTMQYIENGETKSKELARYSYSGLRLTGMQDVESDYGLEFAYTNGKVSHIQEKAGGITGTQKTASYISGKKTSCRNLETNLCTHYLFDYEGRTVNAYSTYGDENVVLGATNALYHEKEDQLDKSANRITQTASIGKAAQQRMKNGGMEETTVAWAPHGGGEVIYSPEKARTGNYVFRGTLADSSTYADNHILSEVLTAGKTYTFSAYVNTIALQNITGTGVYVQVVNGSDVWFSNRVDYATADCVNEGWVRVAVTFEPKATGIHTLCICGTGAEGVFYADDAQLEEAEAPSNINLAENGSIGLGTYGWVLGENAAYDTVEGITPWSIRIHGDCSSTDGSCAYQVIPLNLPGTESYVLSGWVKANAVPDDVQTAAEKEQDQNKQCGLRAVLNYTDGSAPEYFYEAFDPDIEDWQFVSLPVVPKQPAKTVASIQVICAYEKNANTAYFDDISLVREMAQTMVYKDGKLTSVTATDLDTETYSYDGNNNLIQLATGGSGVFHYTYDTTYMHRLLSVTNGQITQSMTYDGVGNTTSSKLTNVMDDKYMESSTTYTDDGNHILTVTDGAGSAVTYDYGRGNTVMWDLPVSVTAPDATVTTMEYDEIGRLKQTALAGSAQLRYTYSKGLLGSIQRTAKKSGTDIIQTYSMDYDVFGNRTAIRVGNKNLASYEYDSLRRLAKLTYANNQALTYTYDTYGRIKSQTYPDGRAVTYAYNGDGSVHSISEKGGDSDSAYIFEYDSLGRLMTWEKREELNRLSPSLMYVTQDFDESNRLIYQTWKYPMDLTFTNRYSYKQQNGTMSAMDVGNDHANFGYDSLLRLSVMDCGILTRTYTYRDITDTKTTSQVTKLTYTTLGFDFEYTYDNMGNIASYTTPGGNTTHYTYDDQGQLISANGVYNFTYTYDGAGNLLTSDLDGTSHTYTYGDANWKDLLTAFDGQSITYDEIGNPLSYYNGTRWTFTWSNGKRLKTATNGIDTISYTYEADGQRTTKTVNDVEHNYYYYNGLLMRETYGDTTLDFFYDANGVPFSMLQNRSNWYYYVTNLEGDVIRLVDCYGNVAAMYKYDPYGREIYAYGSHAEINPLRYRSYYYDTETEMYYVSSRYYDPEVGRFISADTTDILGATSNFYDKNLYAYCDNNPVMRKDTDGEFWVVSVAVGVGTQYIGDVIGNLVAGKSGMEVFIPTSSVGEYVAAGVTALIPGSGFGGALIRNVITEAIVSIEREAIGEENSLQSSVVNIIVGTTIDASVEWVSDKVTECITSITSTTYSQHANSVRKKNPNATTEAIRKSAQRSVRWGID